MHSLLDGGEEGGRRDSTSSLSFLKVGKRPRNPFLMSSPEGPILKGLIGGGRFN
jgi:hypothetical protein